MKNKKRNRIFLLLILLLGIGVGFAALATTLKINGSTTIGKNTWNIYWDNIANESGVTPETATVISDEDTTHKKNIVTFAVTFNQPGDYYEFNVDAVNAGTLDAEILSIEKKYNDTVIPEEEDSNNRVVPAYLKYEVTYADGTLPAIGDGLAKAQDLTSNPPVYTIKTYKIRVEYDRDAVTNADINNQVGNVTHEFSFKVDYGQATPASSPWVLPQGKTPQTLALGDEVCVAGETTECFKFIKYDENNKAVFITKYNINVGERAKGTETFKQDPDVIGYKSGITQTYGRVPFSARTYWINSETDIIEEKYGSQFPVDVYDSDYKTAPDFSDNGYRTPGYSIAYYVEQYKSILEGYGVTVDAARILKASEAITDIGCDDSEHTCPTTGAASFITDTSFWMSTVWYDSYVYAVDNGNFYNYTYSNDSEIGVRPVIVIDPSTI